MRHALVLAVVFTIAGCAKMPIGSVKDLTAAEWQHPTKTLRDFRNDEYECERDNPSLRKARASAMRERCMLTKGWERK